MLLATNKTKDVERKVEKVQQQNECLSTRYFSGNFCFFSTIFFLQYSLCFVPSICVLLRKEPCHIFFLIRFLFFLYIHFRQLSFSLGYNREDLSPGSFFLSLNSKNSNARKRMCFPVYWCLVKKRTREETKEDFAALFGHQEETSLLLLLTKQVFSGGIIRTSSYQDWPTFAWFWWKFDSREKSIDTNSTVLRRRKKDGSSQQQ